MNMSLSQAFGKLIGWTLMLPGNLLARTGFYDKSSVVRLTAYTLFALAFAAVGAASLSDFGSLFIWTLGVVAVVTEAHRYFTFNAVDKTREHLRGNQLVETKVVEKMVAKEESRFKLGSVPMPQRLETRHFLLAGTTGSGKTRVIHQILEPVRDTNARAVVVDIGGAMVSRYYREGDVILNPRDARSVGWSPLSEIKDIDDIPLLAAAIVPDGTGSAAEWNKYAQRLMAAVLQRVWENGGDNAEIIRLLTRAPVEELRQVVEGLPAEGMLREGNEKMLASVLAIVASYITPLSALDPAAGGDAFSVTDWIMNESEHEKSWLFMNFTDRQIEQLKPIICSIISVAASSVLSLKEDQNRRIFFIIDEADALGQISGLASLLTRGRRFGASVVTALQSVSQLYTHYGRDVSNTLLSNLGTQVILRLPDAETAEWASRTFGDEQIREEHVSTCEQGGGSFETSTNTSYQTRQQRIVLASEIQSLPDLRGLLNIAGDIPPCVIDIPPVNPPQLHPEFVKK